MQADFTPLRPQGADGGRSATTMGNVFRFRFSCSPDQPHDHEFFLVARETIRNRLVVAFYR